MIKSVLMMNEAGIPIFSFDYGDPVVDHALISSFFTAMHNVTKQVFLDSIQNLEMGEHQLVFGQRSTEHAGVLYGAIISDARDHPDLIANLLNTFLEQFATKHEKDVQIITRSGICQKFDQFERSIKQEIKKRVRKIQILRKRSKKTRGLGFTIGVALFFLAILVNLRLWGTLGTEMTGLTMVLTLLMLPSGVAGWITGNGRDGLIAASASGSVGVLGLALAHVEILVNWVERVGVANEMGVIIAVLTALLVLAPAYGLVGYIIGTWVSRRSLYPASDLLNG